MIPRIPVVRTLILGLALVLAALPCSAGGLMFYEQRRPSPPIPELAAQPNQIVIDLNGGWECKLDAADGYAPGWVPGCFRGAEGVMSFRRTFALPDSQQALQFQLFLPEIHYAVEVWINGNFISAFTGSHLGFSCDIARNQLRYGAANEILLRVDNRLTPRTTLPVREQILHPANFGGLFGGVYLRGVPAWSIEDVGIVTSGSIDPQAARASVRVQIAQRAPLDFDRDVRLRVTLRDSTGAVVAEASSDPLAHGSTDGLQTTIPLPRFTAALWSPERPALYRLTGELIAGADTLHRLTRVVGFKNVEIRGNDLYLNGTRLHARGIDYVPEDATAGRVISAEQLRRDLTQIRELGMNLVRIPFAPPSPDLARTADELGLLLLVETDLYWIPSEVLNRPAYRTLVKQTFDQIIATLHDHVSILAWGLGGQLDWQNPATHEFSRGLYESFRQQDTRPCYVETTLSSLADGLADFALVTLPAGGGNAAAALAQNSRMPVMITRVGRLAARSDAEGGAAAGIVNQAEFVVREVQALKSSDSITGYIVHAFADYHGSSPLLGQPDQKDPLLYSFGLLGFDRHERLAYGKLLDIARTGQTTLPVPTGNSEHNPAAFPVISLAALVLLSVELRRNNVFRQNLKRVFLHAHGFYSDLRYRRFLHTAQPMLLGVLEALTLSVLLASILYALRGSFALDYYLTHFLPWPATKAWLVNLIWAPVRLVVYFTGIFLILIIAQMVMVRVTGIFFRERVDLWQAANYVIWAFAGLLYLLPLAVIFYRVLNQPNFALVAILAVIGVLGWCFIRLLGALRTGFGGSPLRVYAAVLGIGILLTAVALVLLENRLGTLTYLQFFHDVFGAR